MRFMARRFDAKTWLFLRRTLPKTVSVGQDRAIGKTKQFVTSQNVLKLFPYKYWRLQTNIQFRVTEPVYLRLDN